MNNSSIVLLLTLLAGCSSATPNYDAKFGDAVREAKLKMTSWGQAGRRGPLCS